MNSSEISQFKESFGKRIKSLREERGLKVREFALIAEIEHHQLINIEKGRVDMRLSTILKLALAFEMSVDELLRL